MAIDLELPPCHDGRSKQLPLCTRSLVIIGANGSGKSRFAAALARTLGDGAYRVSALQALYDKGSNNDLQALMKALVHDEMAGLLNFKFKRAAGAKTGELRHTRLDRLIELWQEIYPGNDMLIESERLMFMRRGDSESYAVERLSDGERAVLYIIGAMLYAPTNAVVIVDSPEMFLHPTVMMSLWNRLEQVRHDCTMVYVTHDIEFASSRQGGTTIWVKNYNSTRLSWDYAILPPGSPLSDEIYMAIMGARKPVLFIEGDSVHSIDARLYPLIFKDYTVKSLGSCDKVIEATRTFNDLNSFHHMTSRGIVDRDRRDDKEIDYLRRKNILVPDVAEIENMLLLENVVRAAATARGRRADYVVKKVKQAVIKMFATEYRQQALMHTRRRVKRTVEYHIDSRFTSIDQLEEHLAHLVYDIAPRQIYDTYCREFERYIQTADYDAVLRVYNRKSMLPGSNVSSLLGFHGKDAYLNFILHLLREDGERAADIRNAVYRCFRLENIEK